MTQQRFLPPFLILTPFLACLFLSSCVWPKRRFAEVPKDQTVKAFYESKGVPLSVIEKEARLKLDKIIVQGQKVFVPYERLGRQKSDKRKKSIGGPSGPFDGQFIWPVQGGTLSSEFGYRWKRFHEGIDLVAPIGTPVHAAASGEVLYATNEIGGYGNMVVIKHVGDYASVYAHNKVNYVKKGQKVEKGQKIAELGNSGKSTGPHMHFEIRKSSKPIDPQLMLPAQKKRWADNLLGRASK